MKRFLDQDFLGESLDEFRSEVQAVVFTPFLHSFVFSLIYDIFLLNKQNLHIYLVIVNYKKSLFV